jgi:hypothetical protein
MRWIRPRLARIAGSWLVFHLCLLVSIPSSLCSTASAGVVKAECTCGHGDGNYCPMHHPQSKATKDPHSCSCRPSSDPIAAIAASLIGPAAVLAPSVSTIVPARAVALSAAFDPSPLDSLSVPDSPPPRR